ncbi:MAG: hypothetical protein ACTHJW_04630 [Streptosporangiaceae bacterium]
MKITKKIAAATLVPAAAVGITVSSLAVAWADPSNDHAHAASTSQQLQRQAAGGDSIRQALRSYVTQAAQQRAKHEARSAAHAQKKARAHAHAKAQPTSMFAGMSSFERCVAWRESGNNPTASSAGLFGILPSTWASLGYAGTAGTSSVALQKQAFDRLYAMDGTSPWAPYDGC